MDARKPATFRKMSLRRPATVRYRPHSAETLNAIDEWADVITRAQLARIPD